MDLPTRLVLLATERAGAGDARAGRSLALGSKPHLARRWSDQTDPQSSEGHAWLADGAGLAHPLMRQRHSYREGSSLAAQALPYVPAYSVAIQRVWSLTT